MNGRGLLLRLLRHKSPVGHTVDPQSRTSPPRVRRFERFKIKGSVKKVEGKETIGKEES